MQLTFNGVVIARGPDFGGFDAITGFEPECLSLVEWGEALDGVYATPFPRGNVKTTLQGTITRAPSASLGQALAAKAMEYAALPPMGDLVIQLGIAILTFPAAVKGPGKPLRDLQGLCYAYQITFYAGVCVPSNLPLLNLDSTPLLNVDGSTPLINS